MIYFVGLLTFVLVLNCLLLILLVLVQLPKKDAGAGMAFGGGTADALFGAGSGNALTKITKWAAGIFLGLALVLGWLQGTIHKDTAAADFANLVEQQKHQTAPATPAPKPQAEAAGTVPLPAVTIPTLTNAAAVKITNSAK
jgi:protein translocase SecG subunit